ncbi:MAG: metallophosphoesterase [Akkermansiaceae bacterium]|nr:metallophosphoesterase [Akkermansiaceae bacterium]
MKRRGFLGRVAGGAVAGSAGFASAAEPGDGDDEGAAKEGGLTTTPVVIMAPRHDGVEVVWGVSRLCHGWVEWQGPEGGSGRADTDPWGFVPQGNAVIKVKVRGWKAGADYSLRTVTVSRDGSRREESAWKKIRTLDPGAAATRFVVWNDTHENGETIRQLHAATPAADFLLWNGDTCNNWVKEELLIPTLLNPAGQDISAGRPLLFTWGNHDVRGKWAFRMPGIVATPDDRPYYAFRSGPVALIFLHTGEDKPDAHPSFEGRVAFEKMRREQAEWLRATIERPELRDAPYRVLCCHIPLRWIDEGPQDYANGGFDRYSRSSRDLWHDSLVRWKTQVVISGHTHQARWLAPADGFPYAQATGGGPQLESATWTEITADAAGLKLKMTDLAGRVVVEQVFEPVA